MAVKHAQTLSEAIIDGLDTFNIDFEGSTKDELVEEIKNSVANLIKNKIMPVSLVIDDVGDDVSEKFDKFMECLI